MAFFYAPPPPFTGGAQPYGQQHLVQGGAAAAADNPPFSSRGTAAAVAVQAWQSEPYQQPNPRRAALPGWAVDAPPASTPADYLAAHAAWNIDYVQPQRSRLLIHPGIAAAADTPPPPRFWPQLVVQSWIAPDPGPTLPRRLPAAVTAVPVNDPPFSSRKGSSDVFAAWHAGFASQQRRAGFAALFIAAADNPPPARFWPQIIVQAWTSDPSPNPTLRRGLPASARAIAADNPPFTGRFRWLPNAVSSWQPAPPMPTLGKSVVQPSAAPPPAVIIAKAKLSGSKIMVTLDGSKVEPSLDGEVET